MALSTFQFRHVGTYPLGRHFELAVCIPDKAADTSIFVADGKVDLPVRETDLEPGSVFFVDTERRHFVSERELGSKGRRVEVFFGRDTIMLRDMRTRW
jgi:hypothetical protein